VERIETRVESETAENHVASSLEPYPVRTVRYSIEVDANIEKAIELIEDENHSGAARRHKDDKYEDTMFVRDAAGVPPYEWVRRSVHIAPPPGGNRDAVVMYFEDRPTPRRCVTPSPACRADPARRRRPHPTVCPVLGEERNAL